MNASQPQSDANRPTSPDPYHKETPLGRTRRQLAQASNMTKDSGSSKSVDDPCKGLAPHGNYQKCPVSPSDSVGTACSKCGKPFMVGDTIIGNEAGSWHGDCRLHAIVEASDPEIESTDMRKDDPSEQQAQVAPENDSSELRDIILSVDTTFDMGDSTTQAFLPPNYYVDRLVKTIQSILAAETTKAKKEMIDHLLELAPTTNIIGLLEDYSKNWHAFQATDKQLKELEKL